MKEKKKWYELNVFGLQIKPLYAIIVGFCLMMFLQGGLLKPLGSILFITGIIAFIAERRGKK